MTTYETYNIKFASCSATYSCLCRKLIWKKVKLETHLSRLATVHSLLNEAHTGRRRRGTSQQYSLMSRAALRERERDRQEYNPARRTHTIMCPEDYAAGKKSTWPELEITGIIRNLSPALWSLSHLRCLYLNDNSLQRIPPGIGQLVCLTHLDLSCNKLRSLPAELGDLVTLRQLHLNHNHLRVLPYELGRLFRLHTLGEMICIIFILGGAIETVQIICTHDVLAAGTKKNYFVKASSECCSQNMKRIFDKSLWNPLVVVQFCASLRVHCRRTH
ncbi:hypothetical protein V5799_031353 [Amblyomma americanum]|uniref:Disease resistance R13L4/SHOC-2-like LRR domain-containing protein n=1 Tax=Amblyomma americanum TaxID=6943 RepID=A0AAQ4ELJ1_AMBAM